MQWACVLLACGAIKITRQLQALWHDYTVVTTTALIATGYAHDGTLWMDAAAAASRAVWLVGRGRERWRGTARPCSESAAAAEQQPRSNGSGSGNGSNSTRTNRVTSETPRCAHVTWRAAYGATQGRLAWSCLSTMCVCVTDCLSLLYGSEESFLSSLPKHCEAMRAPNFG